MPDVKEWTDIEDSEVLLCFFCEECTQEIDMHPNDISRGAPVCPNCHINMEYNSTKILA